MGRLVVRAHARSPKERRGVKGRRTCVMVLSCWMLCVTVGCGASDRGTIVARVAGQPVWGAQLDAVMRWLAPGHVVPDPPRYAECIARNKRLGELAVAGALRRECEVESDGLQRRGFDFLLSSEWLTAEANRLRGDAKAGRPAVSVAALLKQRSQAIGTIEQHLRAMEAPVRRSEVRGFYSTHQARFERPETRRVELFEDIPSLRAARDIRRRLLAGRSVSRKPVYEDLTRPSAAHPPPPGKLGTYAAIFAAPPHTYVGPLQLNSFQAVFRVIRVTPRLLPPLERVEPYIARMLALAKHRRVLRAFVERWRTRWAAKTNCARGAAAIGCREYLRSETGFPDGLD